MKPRGRDTPAERLDPELRKILLHGPWSVGKTLLEIPDHDSLRELWHRHHEALLASKGCPRTPWFLDRDAFVKVVRGER
jgi:hypothetical protein